MRSLSGRIASHEIRHTAPSVHGGFERKGISMKKIALMIVAVTALAATASAPAEAHRLHVGPGVAIATDALVPGPGYYYAPTPLYYGAVPVVLPYPGFHRHWW